MSDRLATRLDPDSRVNLKDFPTEVERLDKDAGRKKLAPLREELNTLQELMWGARTHALLVVLQGRDAAGKDGLINHVFSSINPQGLQVTSFKVPTEEEAAHDFLWRVHAAAPRKGMIGVYNRSHYEEVLVVRVHKLAPAEHIEAAYSRINDYERLLTGTGTLVIKCYLHMSKKEQKERLLAREAEVSKAWKLNPGDWAERHSWDDYTAAYEEAIARCNPVHAPWYIIPADQKWGAHLAVAQVLVETLRPYRQGWLDQLVVLQQEMLGQLADVDKA